MKSLISYLITIAISMLYMYFLDEESGLVITAALLIAPLISFAVTFINLKTTKLSLRTSSEVISCGDSVELIIDIKRMLPMISPVIIADFELSANFQQYPKITFRFSPEFKKASQKKLCLDSSYPTNARITVKSIKFSDFLGILSFKSKLNICEYDVAVVPKIAQSANENALFDSFSANLNYDDEHETTNTSYSMHTTAGYEHRDYVESDPLKRINWKLSSKLGKLMIRLDDAVCASKPIFIIDLAANEEVMTISRIDYDDQKKIYSQSLYSRADKLITNLLGTLTYFVQNGIECKVYCTGLKDAIICSDAIDISNLAVSIARRSIFEIHQANDFESAYSDIDGESNIVYCSFSRSPSIGKLLKLCKSANANAAVVLASRESGVDFSGIPAYYYDANGTLKAF